MFLLCLLPVSTVCAKDQAGHVTCNEDSVGVPLKPTLDKKIDPINQGKLYIVAEDTLFWQEQPSEYGYRCVHCVCAPCATGPR